MAKSISECTFLAPLDSTDDESPPSVAVIPDDPTAVIQSPNSADQATGPFNFGWSSSGREVTAKIEKSVPVSSKDWNDSRFEFLQPRSEGLALDRVPTDTNGSHQGNTSVPVRDQTVSLTPVAVTSVSPAQQATPTGSISIAVPAQAADTNPDLILWNRLGSESEIENSQLGLDGTFEGGSFVGGPFAGFGNAYINGQQGGLVHFPKEVLSTDACTIEFWAKLVNYSPSQTIPWGSYPMFFEISDGVNGRYMMLNGNDGLGGSGLCGVAGQGSVGQRGEAATSYFTKTWTYESLLGSGQADQWHHYALVWDKNGIPIPGVGGSGKVATFLDGQLNSNYYVNNPDSPIFSPLTGDRLELLPYGIGNPPGSLVAIDNLKIWDGAKTDFSDRFTEGSGPIYNPTNGHSYEFVSAPTIGWTEAKTAAESKTFNGAQGYLATITSQAEQDFLYSNFGENQFVWMGANDVEQEGLWKWVTGPEAGLAFWSGGPGGNPINGAYSNWDSGQPDNDALFTEDYAVWNQFGSGRWNDFPLSNIAIPGYLVEYSAPIIVTPIIGTPGNDDLTGTNEADSLLGLAGADILQGLGGADTIAGGTGNDLVSAGDGDDKVLGDDGDDNLLGGTGNDTLEGGGGQDSVLGQSGNDSLLGGVGNDILTGGEGNDTVDGGADTDRLLGSAGNDALSGGGGNDTLTGDAGNDALLGGDGNDLAQGGDGNDNLAGGLGDDRLLGGSGNDSLSGNDGQDALTGGFGNDSLSGGAGNDSLVGVEPTVAGSGVGFGAGEIDRLRGDSGRDTFVLGDVNRVYYSDGNALTTGESDYALIQDFKTSEDVIQLKGSAAQYRLDFYTVSPGAIDAALIYDPGVSARGEVIGILKNVSSSLSLTSAAFQFVPSTEPTVMAASEPSGSLSQALTVPRLASQQPNQTVGATLSVAAADAGPPVSFGPQTTYDVGGDPNCVIAADFNGDGNSDLAIGSLFAEYFGILLGNGSGGFSAQTTFAAYRPVGVTAGDFNSDGKTDLVISNDNSGYVSVVLGDGSGNFSAQTTFAAESVTRQVSVADFNGDGKTDLAVPNLNSDNVSILLGNGSGNFSAQTTYAVGDRPLSIATGDFNGDGKTDLATANDYSNNVSVLLGNGSGNFSAQTTYAVGDRPLSIVTGDFNTDGKSDLATANYDSNMVSVLLGNGNGGFSAQTTFDTGSGPFSLSTGDFNGDGKTDLAVANQYSDHVSVLLGNGSGAFSAQTTFAVGSGPWSVFTADFNGDGKNDLVTANRYSNNVSVLLNTTEFPVVNAIIGTPGNDVLTGTNGTDSILGLAGADILEGLAGNDTLSGGSGNDLVTADEGNDTVTGDEGNDNLLGGTGNDTLNAGVGRDTLLGESGNDSLLGGDGTDRLNGGDGNDSLNGGLCNDTLLGEAGNDLLLGDAGDDSAVGGDGDDTLAAGLGQDRLFGGSGNDSLSGNDGHDTLTGGFGNDSLVGGTGNDTLIGVEPTVAGSGVGFGAGEVDRFRGDSGRDTFVLGDASRVYYSDGDPLTSGEADYALITDFNSSEDVIRLKGSASVYLLDFYTVSPGLLNAALIYDPGVSARGEVIGILQNVSSSLSLTSPAFSYV